MELEGFPHSIEPGSVDGEFTILISARLTLKDGEVVRLVADRKVEVFNNERDRGCRWKPHDGPVQTSDKPTDNPLTQPD